MRIALAVVAAMGTALGAGGCFYAPPDMTLERSYKTALPDDVTVVHYYSDAYKDPQFLWVFSPINEPFLNRLIAGGRLKPAPANASDGDRPGSIGGGGWPRWWDAERFEALPELYYRDPGPDDGSYYRVWVDRKTNRLYVLFVNT